MGPRRTVFERRAARRLPVVCLVRRAVVAGAARLAPPHTRPQRRRCRLLAGRPGATVRRLARTYGRSDLPSHAHAGATGDTDAADRACLAPGTGPGAVRRPRWRRRPA